MDTLGMETLTIGIEEEEPVIVYVHGVVGDKEIWYRVELQTTTTTTTEKDEEEVSRRIRPQKMSHRKRTKIHPTAMLCRKTYGKRGSWTVIDGNIYWIGGCDGNEKVFSHFIKHNIHSCNLNSWETISTPMNIPRSSPFVTAVGRKLYVIGGNEHFIGGDYHADEFWGHCGQLYDLDNKTWEYLPSDISEFDDYAMAISPAEDCQIVFYDLSGPLHRPLYRLDLHDGNRLMRFNCYYPRNLDDAAILQNRFPWVRHLFTDNLENDGYVIAYSTPVFSGRALYWFTPNLRLVSFDLYFTPSSLPKWSQSPSLQDKLPKFKPGALSRSHLPILLGLHHGNFLVILPEDDGNLTMATITISNLYPLSVTVDSVQSFSFDHLTFKPFDAKALIWGNHGQWLPDKPRICLLNCGPIGFEILEKLTDGVGAFTIVDGPNGVCDTSRGCEPGSAYIKESAEELIETNPSFFLQFKLIIATQLVEASMVRLDRICRKANIALIFARSYGCMGLVRISVKEHTVIDSKPGHSPEDLRLNNPWLELRRFAETIDLNTTDAAVREHIPYIIILVKIAEEWANLHGGNLPSTREEEKQFKDLITSKMITSDEENYKEAMEASSKVFSPRGISPTLQKIIEDKCTEIDSNSSDFWVMVAALKEFIANEGGGETPLEGSIPDITSSTELYVNLQKTYQAKAETDFVCMERRVRNLLKKVGRDTASITKAYIKSFCKNARRLVVCRYQPIEDEFNSAVLPELQKYGTDEDYGSAVDLYILLRAVDQFAQEHSRIPGHIDSEMDADISWIRTAAVGLLYDLGCNVSTLSHHLIHEMCRQDAKKVDDVAAFVGKVASQEAIKLITGQLIPISGTLIFNGIHQKSQML